MSAPLSKSARTVRLAGLLLIVLTACITDLRVGIERRDPVDAGTPDDEPDAGDHTPPEPCEPADCGPLAADAGIECPQFVPPEYVCARNDDDTCEWMPTGECEDPNAPCQQIDCEGPLLISPDRLACSDGSEPTCDRDAATGLCTFQCPTSGACGTEGGSGCAGGEYCWFKEGLCGAGNGGQCTPRPGECNPSVIEEAVCGCDGQTYASACEAAKLGVNIAFVGSCSEPPQLCETCSGPAPTDPSASRIACEDGEHFSGPHCIQSIDGMCHWQWLECPDTRDCASSISEPIMPGRCFGPEDCAEGETCEGASLCPCDAECFAADTPGYCKSH